MPYHSGGSVKLMEEDKTQFNNVIFTCAFVIANLSVLFEPFMPFCCEKIRKYFGLTNTKWEVQTITAGQREKFEPLFTRLTEKDVL